MMFADIISLWKSAMPAGLAMLALAIGFSVALLIASKKLRVEVDPQIERIYEVLPRIDCGACGFAGCATYAKAVSTDPQLIGRCIPGGAATSAKIAEILNFAISDSQIPYRPIVHCRAHTGDKTYLAKYTGIPSCTSANALANAQACKFGCLGFGDCKAACKFGAITIIDGLATIDYTKCTGCTACVKACPRGIIEMVPFISDVMMAVACRSRESGRDTRTFCKVGCIACGLCAKQTDAFVVADNLARLDYSRYRADQQAFEVAMSKCPTGVIVLRGKNAGADRPARG